MLLLVFVAWLLRTSILTGFANAWIVEGSFTKADSLFVLGGGVDYCPFEAARVYHDGLVTKVVILQVEVEPSAELA